MTRIPRLLLLLAAALTPGAAAADILDAAPPIADAQLSQQRGGFSWGGMEIALGAEIRTFLDGSLALQTNVSWTAAGASTTQVVSGALTPASAAQLQAGILSTGGMTMRVGDAVVFLANEGQTALMHRSDGGLQNILVNTASNVSASQEVAATLDLSGYDGFAAVNMASRMGDSYGGMIADATGRAIGR